MKDLCLITRDGSYAHLSHIYIDSLIEDLSCSIHQKPICITDFVTLLIFSKNLLQYVFL